MLLENSLEKSHKLKHKHTPLVCLSLGLITVVILRDLPADALVVCDSPVKTDAAIVFGGDPGFERTRHASRLYHEGLTEFLLLCGGEPGPGDSARSLYEQAVRLHVPARKILLEDRSTSTRETILSSISILEDHHIHSLTLVTSPYHQRRAFLAARKMLGERIELVNSPAHPSFWGPKGWWRRWNSICIVLSEYGKLAYYFVRGWI